jgi:hypothetical protein
MPDSRPSKSDLRPEPGPLSQFVECMLPLQPYLRIWAVGDHEPQRDGEHPASADSSVHPWLVFAEGKVAMRGQRDDRRSTNGVGTLVRFPVQPAAATVSGCSRYQCREGSLTVIVLSDPRAVIRGSTGNPGQRDHFTAGRERAYRSCGIDYLGSQHFLRVVIATQAQQEIMNLGNARFGLGIGVHKTLVVERGEPVLYGGNHHAETGLGGGIVLHSSGGGIVPVLPVSFRVLF